MIECIAKQNIQTADELREAVQDCKKELRGTQVGKNHKLMGAGGKTILLVSKTDKEFVSYEEVMNKSGHFGKLLFNVFFEEDVEEPEFSVEDVFLDLQEKLSAGQLAELSDKLAGIIPNRVDFSRMYTHAEDFTPEINDAKNWYVEIENIDIIRAFGILEAINVSFDSDKSKWDIKRYGRRATLMVQEGVAVQFLNSEEFKDDWRIGEIPKNAILSRTEYGDALFRKNIDGETQLIIITDSPYDVAESRWL